MERWEKYIYGLSRAALCAIGVLFVILGIGSLFLSFTAFFMLIKRKTGFRLF